MVTPKLQERSLNTLSRIQVRYLVGPATRHPHLQLLVIKYVGAYPRGAAGPDATRFMLAMARAGLAAFEPWGIIHDLSELTYEWGDGLDKVFKVAPGRRPGRRSHAGHHLPDQHSRDRQATSRCCWSRLRDAIGTLLRGQASQEPFGKTGYVFRDLAAAWEFVDAQSRDGFKVLSPIETARSIIKKPPLVFPVSPVDRERASGGKPLSERNSGPLS